MNLLNYPHLPMLDPGDCLKAMKLLGIRATDVAEFTGYSNPAVYDWMLRSPPTQTPSVNAVNELAYRALAAYRNKTLPVDDTLGSKERIEALRAALLSVNLMDVQKAVAPRQVRPFIRLNTKESADVSSSDTDAAAAV